MTELQQLEEEFIEKYPPNAGSSMAVFRDAVEALGKAAIKESPRRPQMTNEDFDSAISRVSIKLAKRIDQKGLGIFVSSHEILGIITEEYLEYENEVHVGSKGNQEEELVDIAVACIFGLASMGTSKMDWPK